MALLKMEELPQGTGRVDLLGNPIVYLEQPLLALISRVGGNIISPCVTEERA